MRAERTDIMRPETLFILAVAVAVGVIILAIRKTRRHKDAPGDEATRPVDDGEQSGPVE
jgi:hypothetical protein